MVVTGATGNLIIIGQLALGPPATEITELAPRSTTIFENEQQVRIQPEANFSSDVSTVSGSEGISTEFYLTPNATTLEETVTRVRTRGHLPNALPAVAKDTSGVRSVEGESLGNKFFTLRGGATPNVPTTYAITIIDPDNSILDNSGDGTITLDYQDDSDVTQVESWTLSSDGLGPFYTAQVLKSVNHVEGSGFDTSGLGAPVSTDTLIVGPAADDTVDGILATSGVSDGGPASDPNSGFNDGDGSYISADDIADQRVYMELPDVTDLNLLSIDSVTIDYYFKNLPGSGSGIEGIVRDGDSGVDNIVVSAFTTAGTDNGLYTQQSSGALTEHPVTTSPWTVSDLNDLQVGVRFKGDNPTIEKRCAFIRVRVLGGVGFVHPTIHGDDLANLADLYQVVAKDPFTTPTDDATQYVQVHADAQDQNLRFEMEDLETEATSVNYVNTNVRATYRHVGEKNSSGEGDNPCGIAAAPRSNNVERNRLEGPREQTNFGGLFVAHNLTNILFSSRFAVSVGDPAAGCGNFGNFDGEDVGYGTYIDINLNSTLTHAANPISATNVNDMVAGVTFSETRIAEYRLSRVYSEVEYLRDPTGSTFFHLVVNDDSDATFMRSQHSTDKKMGVDFAGIQETSKINSLTIIMRAMKHASATVGWRAVLRIPGQDDIVQPTETNTTFEDKEYTLSTNPNTSAPFTRTEVNSATVYFEALGETPYYPKDVSKIRLRINFIPIPSKIDNARRIQSSRLLMLSKPIGMLRWTAPMAMAGADMMRDVVATHRNIPRTFPQIGIEQWERTLLRVFTKTYELDSDRLSFNSYDMRNYLVTFLFTGQTTKKGRSFDGMMVITNGVTVQFERATNAYMQDPFLGRLQELNTDEPETGIEGVRVENTRTNLLLNAGFGEGASNVYTSWTQTGLPATGASITDSTESLGWDTNFQGSPQRAAKIVGADTPADIGFVQTISVPTGDSLSPPGSRYVAQIYHQDNSGYPLSVAFSIDPPGFSEEHFEVGDQKWASGSEKWWSLPVATTPTIHRVPGHFPNIEFVPSSPASANRALQFKIAARTFSNQVNHLYGAQLEGGTFDAGDAATYPSSLILTRTGAVLREIGKLWVPNKAANPTYYFTRNTFFCVAVPNWDSADLPWNGGERRYVFSNVIDPSNHDRLYYDQDLESWVFERHVGGITSKATRYYPAVSAGVPIRLATRCISSVGDLGEAANSIQIFVDDIAGVGATPASIPTMSTESEFYIGSEEGLNGTAFDGTLKRFRITQQALRQSDIAKLR